MADVIYPFKLGQFDCTVVSDGLLTVGPGIMELTCLLIKRGNRRILIDTGCGISVMVKAGMLVQNLKTIGVRPSQIDMVIHSHAHLDHVGGNVDADGKIVFPNARYVIFEKEWAYWEEKALQTKPGEKGGLMVDTARKCMLPFRDRFDLVKEGEVLPGIALSLAPGHTPGNMVITLSSQGQQLVCIGDLIHDPLEFANPEKYAMIDTSHADALHWRSEVISKAHAAQTLVWACHFPFPGVGHIAKQGDLFVWQPLK